ncbi:4463_t:CDS:1, partial [Acaulospora morrowiae]
YVELTRLVKLYSKIALFTKTVLLTVTRRANIRITYILLDELT